jgi:uncharacterized protein with GYD domain
MAKFLIAASYTAEGLRGVAKDKASGRSKAVSEALAALGGKLETIYYALGDTDVFVIADCPDNITAAGLSFAVSSSGLVRTKTIPLLTVEEMDQAIGKQAKYRAPGS